MNAGKQSELIQILRQFNVSRLSESGRELKYKQLQAAGVSPITDGDLWQELYEIERIFRSLTTNAQEEVLPYLFDFMERCGDIDIGSPGPIVHGIESSDDLFVPHLEVSVKRKPTPLTVWMINRIINGEQPIEKRQYYTSLLAQVLEHPLASDSTKKEAREFLNHQRAKTN